MYSWKWYIRNCNSWDIFEEWRTTRRSYCWLNGNNRMSHDRHVTLLQTAELAYRSWAVQPVLHKTTWWRQIIIKDAFKHETPTNAEPPVYHDDSGNNIRNIRCHIYVERVVRMESNRASNVNEIWLKINSYSRNTTIKFLVAYIIQYGLWVCETAYRGVRMKWDRPAAESWPQTHIVFV